VGSIRELINTGDLKVQRGGDGASGYYGIGRVREVSGIGLIGEMICHCFTHNMGGLEVARNQSKVIEFTILLRLARALYRAISATLCFAMERCILPLTGRGFRVFEDEVMESFTLPEYPQRILILLMLGGLFGLFLRMLWVGSGW
jgi:hypothetical protein